MFSASVMAPVPFLTFRTTLRLGRAPVRRRGGLLSQIGQRRRRRRRRFAVASSRDQAPEGRLEPPGDCPGDCGDRVSDDAGSVGGVQATRARSVWISRLESFVTRLRPLVVPNFAREPRMAPLGSVEAIALALRIRGDALADLTTLRLRLGCLRANSDALLPANRGSRLAPMVSQGQLQPMALRLFFGDDGFTPRASRAAVAVRHEAARHEHHGPSRPQHQQGRPAD